MESCENCKFARKSQAHDDKVYCLRYPPSARIEFVNTVEYSAIMIDKDYWCGEFKQK